MIRSRLLPVVVALLLTLGFAPSVSAQQGPPAGDVLVRVNGDLDIAATETVENAVGFNSRVTVDGTVLDRLTVIGGSATVNGAVGGELQVVNGTLKLGPNARVGEVVLTNSTMSEDAGAAVSGDVSRGPGRSFSLLGSLFSTLWWFGITLLALLAAVVVAFVAPTLSRLAGQSLTREVGGTIAASALLWIGLPLLGLLLVFTIVGVPVSLAIWFGLMPLLWLVGFAISSIRVGDEIAVRANPGMAGRSSVGPAILGVLVLRLVGLVPVIGGLVVFLAGILGAGALAWRLWRERQTTKATPLPPVTTVSP